MSKLIRLVGNTTTGKDTEIRNVFQDNIHIPRGSTISLRNVNADLVPTSDSDAFEIPANTSYSYGPQSSGAAQLQVNVPADTYNSANALLHALNIAANTTGAAGDSYLGLHNVWELSNVNQGRLNVYRGTPSDPDFDDDAIWAWADDSDTTKGTDSVSTGGSGDAQGATMTECLPLVSNRAKLRFGASGPQDMQFAAVPYDDPLDPAWGVDYSSGVYNLLANGGIAFASAYAGAVGDEIQVLKYGTTVQLIVIDSGGTEQVNLTETLQAPYTEWQNIFYDLTIENTVATDIEDVEVITIDSLSPTLNATVPVTISLNFGATDAGQILQKYLGFVDAIYNFSGDPATLTAKHAMRGVIGTAGTLVTIEGLDLESYTGAVSNIGGNANILDVIPVGDNVTKIDYQPSYPMKLKLKNARDLIIRDLTVQFQAATDVLTAKPLRFLGNPVVVLEIHPPEGCHCARS